MKTSCHEFLDTLIGLSPSLRLVYLDTVNYWLPIPPPMTTLFAELGYQIVKDFDEVDANVNHRIFSLVESAMTNGDEQLVTAVATGLIEGIVTKASKRDDLWSRISQAFGDKSYSHANAWKNFGS